ncbi:MAG: hypothetical protein U5K72_17710 [Balneolaceae bacterium]|nr:hypothetical protein [Balneolaceae bacterium]
MKYRELSKDVEGPILYGVFENTSEIENQIFLIERTKFVIGEIESDKIAERELKGLLDVQIDELNSMIMDNIYSAAEDLRWTHNGFEFKIKNSKTLNNELSKICERIYHKTPIFDNELINKEKVSPAIYKPRKTLLKLLIESSEEENLGLDPDTFPAEKTIYLSLFEQNGVHAGDGETWEIRSYADEDQSDSISFGMFVKKFFEAQKQARSP